MQEVNRVLLVHRDVFFEFHPKFWNTAIIGIPVRSLLKSRQTFYWSNCSTKKEQLDNIQIKHLYPGSEILEVPQASLV